LLSGGCAEKKEWERNHTERIEKGKHKPTKKILAERRMHVLKVVFKPWDQRKLYIFPC
jgi:hypothetical protein